MKEPGRTWNGNAATSGPLDSWKSRNPHDGTLEDPNTLELGARYKGFGVVGKARSEKRRQTSEISGWKKGIKEGYPLVNVGELSIFKPPLSAK